MALSKTFAEGQVLTGRDVNDHLANHVPRAGDPYTTDAYKVPNPGAWSNHTVYLQRVGLLVVFTANLSVGTASTGALIGRIPEDMRPVRDHEEALVANAGGGTPVQLRISAATGDMVAYWPNTVSSNNFVRGSSVWVAG